MEKQLDRIVSGALAWASDELDASQCVIELDAQVQEELRLCAAQVRAQPLPRLLCSPAHFELAATRAALARARRALDEGRGIAVLDALPLQDFSTEDALTCYWVLSQLLARPVAQKWDGTMLYDVRDTGQRYEYGVRGSRTNVELVFHTDNAFGSAPPDYVGLLALRTARSGGVSRFASLYSVHNRLLTQHPDALRRLYEPFAWDRQHEHAPGTEPVAWAPVFRFDGRKLSVRANVSLVRKGYEVAGESMDSRASDALAALESVTQAADLWFELPLQRGQVQLLNNRHIAHYRSEFEDDEDPTLRRHLVRTWHRDWGLPSYDG